MNGRPSDPVVVGFDGSVEARAAVDLAAWEACRRQVPLRLVTVYQPPRSWTGTVYVSSPDGHTSLYEARSLLDAEVARSVARYPQLATEPELRTGDPRHILTSTRACLVVVGFRGMGSWRCTMLGSVATGVALECPVPAIVVHPAVPGPVDRRQGVVAAIGTPDDQTLVAFALDEAAARDTDLTVVRTGVAARRVPAPAAAGYRDVATIETVVVDHNRVRALIEFSSDADLLVVGRDNDTAALVGNATVPVAVLPVPARHGT